MPASVLKIDYRGDRYRIPFDPKLGCAATVADVCGLVPQARVGLLAFSDTGGSLRFLTDTTFPEFLTTGKIGSGGHSILRLQLQLPGAILPQEEVAVSQSKPSTPSNRQHPSQEGSSLPKRPSGAVRRARAREKKAAHIVRSSKCEEDIGGIDELLTALDHKPLPVGEVKASMAWHKQHNGCKKGTAAMAKQAGKNKREHAEAYQAVKRVDVGLAEDEGLDSMEQSDVVEECEEHYEGYDFHEGHRPEKQEKDQSEPAKTTGNLEDEDLEHKQHADHEERDHDQEQQGDKRHTTEVGKHAEDVVGARLAAAAMKITSIDMSRMSKWSGADKQEGKACQASECGTESTCEDMPCMQEDTEDDAERNGVVGTGSELPEEPKILWPATPESSPLSSPRFFHSQFTPVCWVPVPVWVPGVQ